MSRTRRPTRRFLATVLFTDIVGSTELATRLGDHKWRALIEQHHAVVRRQLRAFHGREMDTAGDGFFTVFETPADGVRCAGSLHAALAPLGIEIRAGLHTGECEVIGGKVGGLAVTVGARVAALAEAGQVLVTGSARDLSLGSGLRFEPRGERKLKGIDEAVPIFQFLSEPVDEPTALRTAAPAVPLWTRRTRRRLVAFVAVLAVMLGGVASAVVLLGSDPAVAVPGDAVGILSEDGDTATAAIPVGSSPNDIVSGFGAVWVTNSAGNTLSRIDPASHDVIPIRVGEAPAAVAVGAGSVWVANSGDSFLSRVDPETYEVTNVALGSGAADLVFAARSVWVTSPFDASVVEVDPRLNKVVRTVTVGAGPTGIAYGGGLLWVANQSEGTVTPIEPSTGRTEAAVHVGNAPVKLAVGGGAVWVTNNVDGSLSRIDLRDRRVSTRAISPSGGAYGVAVSDRDVWVSSQYGGTLTRVDTRSLDLAATVRTGVTPLGLAFVDGRLWFTAGSGGTEHRGGTLRVRASALGVPVQLGTEGADRVLDPARAYDENLWRLLSVTNDGLVGYRRVGGSQGGHLVADLATSLPAPSDDGKTYVFQLRRGIRYSTGEPVRAGDIRHGLERTLQNDVTGFFYQSIIGAQFCRPGGPTCDLSKGVVTDDRAGTVTFHLSRPDPDFLYKLGLPGAYALPPSVPRTLSSQDQLPATGPYRIASFEAAQTDGRGQPTAPGRAVVLRNPHFRVWSAAAQPDGFPDRIVIDVGFPSTDSVHAVQQGKADLVVDLPLIELPPELATASAARLHRNERGTLYIWVDTRVSPFDDARARRALALALDRGGLASDVKGFFAGQTTCQILPPNFEGHSRYCPFTLGGADQTEWRAPDLARAQALVAASGAEGTRVGVLAVDDPVILRPARAVARALDAIGFRGSVRILPGDNIFDAYGERGPDVQVAFSGWFPDYQTASSFLVPLGTCGADSFNLTGSCLPPATVESALRAQTENPGAASRLWAGIDHSLVDDAAVIPVSNYQPLDLTSRRVGNYQYHPQFGALLGQMWVR